MGIETPKTPVTKRFVAPLDKLIDTFNGYEDDIKFLTAKLSTANEERDRLKAALTNLVHAVEAGKEYHAPVLDAKEALKSVQ